MNKKPLKRGGKKTPKRKALAKKKIAYKKKPKPGGDGGPKRV